MQSVRDQGVEQLNGICSGLLSLSIHTNGQRNNDRRTTPVRHQSRGNTLTLLLPGPRGWSGHGPHVSLSRASHQSRVSRLVSSPVWPCPAPHHSKLPCLLFSPMSIYFPGWGAQTCAHMDVYAAAPEGGDTVIQVHVPQIAASGETRVRTHCVGVHIMCVFSRSIKLDKPASGIRGFRAKYWSGDIGDDRWPGSNQCHALAHLRVFLSLHGATGRLEDPGASYWTSCLSPAAEGICIIHRCLFSTNRLSSSSVVLLVLIRGSQHCLGGNQAQHLSGWTWDTEPLLGSCIWQLTAVS